MTRNGKTPARRKTVRPIYNANPGVNPRQLSAGRRLRAAALRWPAGRRARDLLGVHVHGLRRIRPSAGSLRARTAAQGSRGPRLRPHGARLSQRKLPQYGAAHPRGFRVQGDRVGPQDRERLHEAPHEGRRPGLIASRGSQPAAAGSPATDRVPGPAARRFFLHRSQRDGHAEAGTQEEGGAEEETSVGGFGWWAAFSGARDGAEEEQENLYTTM